MSPAPAKSFHSAPIPPGWAPSAAWPMNIPHHVDPGPRRRQVLVEPWRLRFGHRPVGELPHDQDPGPTLALVDLDPFVDGDGVMCPRRIAVDSDAAVMARLRGFGAATEGSRYL